jgi:glycosyltransferase involved in cell wall biosynthesis
MKIGFVIYGTLRTVSGGYLYDRMVIAALKTAGHQIELVRLRPRPGLLSLVDNFEVRFDADFDLLLQDELCHPSLLAANSRVRAYPVVSIVHHLRASEAPYVLSPIHNLVERRYLQGVDAFVFNSTVTRDTVLPLLATRRPSLVAAPGGDRLGATDRAHVLARSGSAGPLRLLFLGNLIPAKGLHILMKALTMLPPEMYTLDVVGSTALNPAHASRMKRRAAKSALPIRFHGALEDDALRERLEESHLLVSPSEYEGFGIAILEAMAHGLPVVAAPSGAIPGLVAHEMNGLLIARSDARALAAAIRSFAEDRRKLAAYGLRALQTFRASPNWERSMATIAPFLGNLVASRG